MEGRIIVRRWIVTGPPGAGKTTLIDGLARGGHLVIPEAATDVVAERGPGCEQDADFLDRIVTLQRSREAAVATAEVDHQVYDRSPVCTLALARHLGRSPTALLQQELDRIADQHVYMRTVLFVEWLGFLTPTEVRRIDVSATLAFAQTHREVYRERGFELIDIPVGSIDERLLLMESVIW